MTVFFFDWTASFRSETDMGAFLANGQIGQMQRKGRWDSVRSKLGLREERSPAALASWQLRVR